MSDASGALVWVDGTAYYRYALVTSEGMIWSWAASAWEVRGELNPIDHLRPMARCVLGPAAWSQDTVPALSPQAGHVVALIYTVDSAGKPSGYNGAAMLTGAPVGLVAMAAYR